MSDSNQNYPYSDEYMIFDEVTKRYVLTEQYVRDVRVTVSGSRYMNTWEF